MAKINEKEVLRVIRKALNLNERALDPNSRMKDIKEWDSLGHLAILSALDKAFGGKIAGIKEMASVDSVKSILKILKDNSLV